MQRFSTLALLECVRHGRRMKSGWTAAAVASVVMLVAPASGAADTFCVHDKACVSDGGTLVIDLQAAFGDAAANGPNVDRVEIGAAHLETGGTAAADNPVTVVGKGESKTTIGDPTIGARIITLASPQSSISDLAIKMDGTDLYGLSSAGDVSRVAVTGNSDTPGEGIVLDQGAAGRHLAISLATSSGTGVYIPRGTGATVEDSLITAAYPVLADGATNVIRRVAADGRFVGVRVGEDAGAATLDSVLVRVSPPSAVGPYNPAVEIDAPDRQGATATTTIRHLTAVGSDAQPGIQVAASCTSGAPSVSLRNSILVDFAHSLVRMGASGCAPDPDVPVSLDVAYTDFDPATISQSGLGTLTAGAGNINADPLFVDPSTDKFGLGTGSPAIDAGSPGGFVTGESTTDLVGRPRIADGDGDGTARRDMGALEAVKPGGGGGGGTGPGGTGGDGTGGEEPPVGGPPVAGEINRTLKLSYSKGSDLFKGKVKSGEDACKRAKVKVFRKRHRDDKKIGSDKTDSKGKLKLRKRVQDGKYYATVAASTVEAGTCESEKSKTVKVRGA
jgi:hypothetical protein